jgi:hypothetical protein
MLIGSLVCLILFFWMLIKVGKQSTLLAFLAFFFWPVLFYAVIKYWGDEESDIKIPFAIFLVAVGYMMYDANKMAKAMKEPEQESRIEVIRTFA